MAKICWRITEHVIGKVKIEKRCVEGRSMEEKIKYWIYQFEMPEEDKKFFDRALEMLGMTPNEFRKKYYRDNWGESTHKRSKI